MAGVARGDPGKILELLDLIGQHEEAFAYDWRTRFQQPLAVVFDGRMSWSEAFDLTMILATDPSSQVGAALVGWRYPVSIEAMALGVKPSEIQLGSRKAVLSQDRVRSTLAALGHGREMADVIELRPVSGGE